MFHNVKKKAYICNFKARIITISKLCNTIIYQIFNRNGTKTIIRKKRTFLVSLPRTNTCIYIPTWFTFYLFQLLHQKLFQPCRAYGRKHRYIIYHTYHCGNHSFGGRNTLLEQHLAEHRDETPKNKLPTSLTLPEYTLQYVTLYI